ncbi:MAG: transposase, partial [Gallionella sp.]
MYDWARFQRTKGAVKLHLVLDHDGYLPCFGLITDGKVADVKAAWQIDFATGTIVVDDRGYNDYRLFADWTESGVYFVTRMKDNALFDVVEEREPPQNRNIVK